MAFNKKNNIICYGLRTGLEKKRDKWNPQSKEYVHKPNNSQLPEISYIHSDLSATICLASTYMHSTVKISRGKDTSQINLRVIKY